jgi:SAM-dependent methyltransferase
MERFLLTDYYKKLHSEEKKYGKPAGPERVEIIRKNVGEGKTVIDLGCRDGTLTKYLIEGNNVIGCDIDDVALSLCEKNLGIKTYHIDLNHPLPFEDMSFDVAVSAEVIEHLAIPEALVKEAHRILKKGGFFLGTVPNAYRIKTRLDFLFGKPLTRDSSHLRFFSYNSLYDLLSRYFIPVSILPLSGHIIGNRNIGIPVTEKTPVWFGKLFSSGFFWKATKNG